MKVCVNCSHNNEDEAKFCVKCGNSFNVKKKKFPSIILWIFIGLVTTIIISSLINFPTTEATYLNISEDYIEFKSDGTYHDSHYNDTCYIKVATDGKWDVSHPGWCKIKKTKAGFFIACLPNIMKWEGREDTVKVISGNFIQKILVYQSYGTYSFLKYNNEYILQNKDTTICLNLCTNHDIEDMSCSFYDNKIYRGSPIACDWVKVLFSKKHNTINEYNVFLNILPNYHEPRKVHLEILDRRFEIQQEGYFNRAKKHRQHIDENFHGKKGMG